jgi:3-oxoacyl-[acyl-carrier-protein] synthase II
MSERRVVITGIGCISPLGNDLTSTWNGLKEGRSGISTITNIDPTPFECKIAGEIKDFNVDQYFNTAKDGRRADRYVQFAVAASKMAMEDSGIDVSKIDPRRFGCMVGSGIGGLSTLEREHTTYMEKGPKRVSPFTIPMMISNIASGIVSMEFGLLGPNMVIVTACATSNHNIGEAWRIIKFGDADAFVCGGAEAAVLPMGLSGFASMKALSKRKSLPSVRQGP